MDVPAIIARADELNKANQWKEEYEYVCAYFQEVRDVELIWRIIRAYYRVGKHHLVKDVAEVARSGMGLYERALEINENNCNIQKWCGIFLSWASEQEGTKCKIEKSFMVKQHFEKAIEMNGSDSVVKHLLGRWCYEVASVSWITRNLAKAIFSTPPVSSYEEALKHFLSSEETSTDLYTGNWLYLGKTYYQLSRGEEAKKWLVKLLEAKPNNVEDSEYQKEGKALFNKL